MQKESIGWDLSHFTWSRGKGGREIATYLTILPSLASLTTLKRKEAIPELYLC